MIDDRPLSVDRVPTLTEVVELDLPVQQPVRADGGEAAPSTDDGTAGGDLLVATAVAESGDDAAAAAETTGALVEAATDSKADDLTEDFVLAGLDADVGLDEVEPAVVAQAVADAQSTSSEPPASAPLPTVDFDAVVVRVLSELMPRIDMLLESRLREALAPALARVADGLIRDTRSNLSVTVRDLVHEAVERALQRRADV